MPGEQGETGWRGEPHVTPTISVVVPFFGSQDHIEDCVRALLTARDALGEPAELLFVDNASPDGSADLVRRALRGVDHATILREETPGAYAARNAALRVARSPLVAFTDADCAVGEGWLRAVRDRFAAESDLGVLLGEVRYPPAASRTLRFLGAYENAKTRHVLSLPPAHHFGYANNMAVRASVFREIGLFRTWRRAGDTELVHRLAARRPDLRTAYEPSMRVVHLEFRSARHRARRLSLYTETNAKIPSFRELSLRQRLGILPKMFRG